MKPAIKDGDLVLYYRLDKDYAASDVIVFKYKGKTQTCRVIAVSGDKVDITGEGLLVNGALQQEHDIYYKTTQFKKGVDFPLTVPKGEVFLLGDCRETTTDSRIFGSVKINDTKGRVIGLIRRRNF